MIITASRTTRITPATADTNTSPTARILMDMITANIERISGASWC